MWLIPVLTIQSAALVGAVCFRRSNVGLKHYQSYSILKPFGFLPFSMTVKANKEHNRVRKSQSTMKTEPKIFQTVHGLGILCLMAGKI